MGRMWDVPAVVVVVVVVVFVVVDRADEVTMSCPPGSIGAGLWVGMLSRAGAVPVSSALMVDC